MTMSEPAPGSGKRSNSRTRVSRPTTPLRPSSRSSLRDSARSDVDGLFPLKTLEPAFAELADTVGDLEANMVDLQLMHESLSRFRESFASFLYGLNMNAFCVDFPETPIKESFRRAQATEPSPPTKLPDRPENDAETTFLTTDTTFLDNPPPPTRQARTVVPGATRASRVPAPSRRGGPQRAGANTRGRSDGLTGPFRSRSRGVR